MHLEEMKRGKTKMMTQNPARFEQTTVRLINFIVLICMSTMKNCLNRGFDVML